MANYDPSFIPWAKARALDQLNKGNLKEAVRSIWSDMSKINRQGTLALIEVDDTDPVSVRRYIEGIR